MNDAIEIVRYQGEHLEQLLRLQQHLWGRDPALNRAYFTWKYETNPYLAVPSIVLALHGDEVVGMRGLLGAKWRLGTTEGQVAIPFADDLVLDPAYRGQGISSRLIGAACDYARDLGYDFVLSLRAAPFTLLDSLAAGFLTIGAMEPVGRTMEQARLGERVRGLLRRTRVLWRWADAAWLQPRADRDPFSRLDRSGTSTPGNRSLRVERVADPAGMAGLAERLPADDRIRHVRDRAYFDWVFRNPRLEYRFLYWGTERLEGYLVLHRERPARSPNTVWISDWEGTSETVCRELLEAAVERGRFTRLASWTATFPESARLLLGRAGFVPIEREARARGRPAALIWPARGATRETPPEVQGRRLTDLATWKLRLLDQD